MRRYVLGDTQRFLNLYIVKILYTVYASMRKHIIINVLLLYEITLPVASGYVPTHEIEI